MSEGSNHESLFLWENIQSWGFSNSDNSGGGGHEKSRTKPPDSGSNSQTPRGTELVLSGRKRTGEGSGEMNEGKGDGGESDHEIHIWTERERRKKMRNMFSNLHALLPQLPPKADKSTIVDEAVNYIKTLQQTLQKLQKQKLERLHGMKTINYDTPIITSQKLAMDSREAFLADQGSSSNYSAIIGTNSSNSFSVSRFPSSTVFQTWTSPNVILNVCGNEAHINVCSPKKPGLLSTICNVLEKHKIEVVSAHVSTDYSRSLYMIQAHASGAQDDQFTQAFPVEEVYKQAAGDILFCVSS